LRLVGAIIGGLIGLGTILWVMPNIDSLAPFLVVVAICTGLAAWIAVGSARTSYAGIQMGMAFALCVLNDPKPTTDLEPARDRVLGVLLGIGVWAFVSGLTGSVLAGAAMRRSLAATLRSLAGMARVGLRGAPSLNAIAPVWGWRWGVYQNLTTTLRLHDESKFEQGAGLEDAEAERGRIALIASDAQAVFLALLALVHHRLSGTLAATPAPVHEPLQNLAQAIVVRLDGLADRIEGRAKGPLPALEPLFARAEEASREALPTMDPQPGLQVPGRIALYKELVGRISQLDRDALTPAAGEQTAIARGAATVNP